MGCPQLRTEILVYKHVMPVRLVYGWPQFWTKNPIDKHIMLVRLGFPLYFGLNTQNTNISYHLSWYTRDITSKER